MNNKRRKVLHDVLDGLERLRDPNMNKDFALISLKDMQDKVEKSMDEEEDSINARPENLAWSAVTMNMQDVLSDLTDANGTLECIIAECEKMTEFNYPAISSDVCRAVHAINLAIYRR